MVLRQSMLVHAMKVVRHDAKVYDAHWDELLSRPHAGQAWNPNSTRLNRNPTLHALVSGPR